MFTKKTLLIIAGVLIITAIVSMFLLSKKSNTNTPVNPDGSVTDNGGVTNVNPSPTDQGRGFVVKEDSAQPFAVINPRSNEPVVSINPGGTGGANFNDYNKAVAAGLIPDKDGLYHQVAVANYDPTKDTSQYDYSLSDSQFLNTYYPDAQAAATGQASWQQNGGDGVITTPAAPVLTKVPTILEADPKKYTTTSDNSPAAIKDYVTKLSSLTTKMDLAYDTSFGTGLVQISDQSKLDLLKNAANGAIDQIYKLPVPSSTLGLSEGYTLLYQQYLLLVEDQRRLIQIGDFSDPQTLAQMQTDATVFSTIVDLIKADAKVVSTLVKQ